MRNFKIAFVGAGYMAHEHAKAFSDLTGVKLIGVTSRTKSSAERLASNYDDMQVFNNIADLYNHTNADLVIVAVKELSMTTVALECFNYPWSVLLEKPAGYNMKNAQLIYDAANANGSRVWVALNRRAYSSTRQALARVNKVNSPRFIRVLDQQDQKAIREIYNESDEVVQNYMFANSIHLIDYFRVFGRGKITRVIPVCKWTPKNPWMVVAKIEFASGDIGVYEGVWNGPGPWAVTVVTAEERLEMRPLEQVSVQLRGERNVNQLEISQDDLSFKPGLRQQAVETIAALSGQINNLPKLEDSFESMKLVSDIFELE